MPLIEKGDKREQEPLRIRLQPAVAEQLKAYCAFAESSEAHIPALTGESFAATGEIFDGAYKEYSSLSNLCKSSPAPAAVSVSTEPPEEFLQIMDAYIELDESALRRLWRDARQIVSDATPEEVRHFFGERAHRVFRNRRVESPVGLLLSSIADWFVKRRVLQRREEQRESAEEYENPETAASG